MRVEGGPACWRAASNTDGDQAPEIGGQQGGNSDGEAEGRDKNQVHVLPPFADPRHCGTLFG
jgi:hypothetical protein